MDAGEMPRTMRCQRHSRATSIGRIPRPCLIHTWYDDDGQLQNATPPSGVSSNSTNSLSNTYDDNGNATSLNGATTVTGTGNRLLSDGTWNYTLDANGNMLSQVGITGGAQAGNEIDYVYDIKNRLTSVTNKTSGVITQVVTYTYDAFGDLIGRTYTPYTSGVAGATTTNRIVYDPTTGQKVLVFDGANNLTTRVLNGAALDHILATETVTSLASAGSVEWLLPNNEGTIDDIIISNDTLKDHLTYNAFGQLTGQLGPNTFTATDVILSAYTGSFYDSATSLVHDGARWYQPSIQRWINEDPTGLSPDANPYRYSHNSPTNESDPYGLEPPQEETKQQGTGKCGVLVSRELQSYFVQAMPRATDSSATIASSVPPQLTFGRQWEADRLKALGLTKNTSIFAPSVADTNTDLFREIVGKPQFTGSGNPVGTIFDSIGDGNLEIKGGSSTLKTSYQIRLQAYLSTVNSKDYTIETSRPVHPNLDSYLDKWKVRVIAPDIVETSEENIAVEIENITLIPRMNGGAMRTAGEALAPMVIESAAYWANDTIRVENPDQNSSAPREIGIMDRTIGASPLNTLDNINSFFGGSPRYFRNTFFNTWVGNLFGP
jgi:RHS repeat-associated protein